MDDSNVRNLVRELLAVLLKADLEFRAELTAKLCYVSQKYAPSPSWLIDTLLKIMAIAGEYVPEQFQNHLIGTITRHPDLHAYAVQKMYASLVTDLSQDVLNQGNNFHFVTLSSQFLLGVLENTVTCSSTLNPLRMVKLCLPKTSLKSWRRF